MALIILSGLARSGKNTFGEILSVVLEDEYTMVAYADALKKKCMEDFDLSYEQVHGSLKEIADVRYPKVSGYWSPREIFQHIGTESYRKIDKDFWIKQLINRISGLENVIVTDGRFPGEIDAIKDIGGIHIRMTRDNRDYMANSSHVSETALDDFYSVDYLVDNNGSLEDLYNAALTIKGDIANGR